MEPSSQQPSPLPAMFQAATVAAAHHQKVVKRIVRPSAAIAKEAPQEAADVRAAIATIPTHVLEALAARRFRVHVRDFISEQWPDLTGAPPGWQGIEWDDLTGAHRGGETTIAISGEFGGTGWEQVTLHEAGHAIDYHSRMVSQQAWFRDWWKQAVADGSLARWAQGIGMSGRYLSQPDGVGQMEWFAELMAWGWKDGGQRAIIEATWPGLLDQMSKAVSDGLQIPC